MALNIHIMTFAFKLVDEFREDFYAADAGNVTWHIFLHSSNPDVITLCNELAERRNVLYYPYGENRGMARSLNEGIIDAQDAGADVVMMLCDDMHAAPGDILRLAETCVLHPECSHVEGHAYVQSIGRSDNSQMDACALNLRCIEAIGYFDRNCWPINFEDVDWKRRAALSGFFPIVVPETRFVHRACNAQERTPEEHEARMRGFYKTRDYYARKWGGRSGRGSFHDAIQRFVLRPDDPT